MSRPGSAKWKAQRNGKKGGAKQVRHTCVNWFHPFLWAIVDKYTRKNCWSPATIAYKLQLNFPVLFHTITRGTIVKWFDKDNRRSWSETMKANVKRYHALAGSGRVGFLRKWPEVVGEITKNLRGLRKAGLAVNVTIARSIMLAIIKKRRPEILTNFKGSDVSNQCICTTKITDLRESDSFEHLCRAN